MSNKVTHSSSSLSLNKRFIKQQPNILVKWHGPNLTFPFLHGGCFYADGPTMLCLFCVEHREKFQTKEHRRSCTGWESNPLHIQLASEMIYEVESENTNGTLHSLNGIIESPTKKCYPNQPFHCDDASHKMEWWKCCSMTFASTSLIQCILSTPGIKKDLHTLGGNYVPI